MLASDLMELRGTLRYQMFHKYNLNLAVLWNSILCEKEMRKHSELELARDKNLAYRFPTVDWAEVLVEKGSTLKKSIEVYIKKTKSKFSRDVEHFFYDFNRLKEKPRQAVIAKYKEIVPYAKRSFEGRIEWIKKYLKGVRIGLLDYIIDDMM